jgi:hypothetical protein
MSTNRSVTESLIKALCGRGARVRGQKGQKTNMRVQKYLSSLILIAAMAGPVAFAASAQEGRRDNDDKDHKVHRYYDSKHRDYHEWNERESSAYTRWEAENHKKHVEFAVRRKTDQLKYWTWRHTHPDND